MALYAPITSKHTSVASITPIKTLLMVSRGVSWLSPWSNGVCVIRLLGLFESTSAIGWSAFWIFVANQDATPSAKQFVSKGLHKDGAAGICGAVACAPVPPAPLPLPDTRSVKETAPLSRGGVFPPVVMIWGCSQRKAHTTQKPKANSSTLLRRADTHFRCTRRTLQVLNLLPRRATICIGHPFLNSVLPQRLCMSPMLPFSKEAKSCKEERAVPGIIHASAPCQSMASRRG